MCLTKDTMKWHFYTRDKFMRIRQNEPLDKFMWFSGILCIVTYYGMVKNYEVQIYVTSAWLA